MNLETFYLIFGIVALLGGLYLVGLFFAILGILFDSGKNNE